MIDLLEYVTVALKVIDWDRIDLTIHNLYNGDITSRQLRELSSFGKIYKQQRLSSNIDITRIRFHVISLVRLLPHGCMGILIYFAC